MQPSRWGSHESRVEWQNPVPCSAAHVALDAAQGAAGFSGLQGHIATSCPAFVCQNLHVLLSSAAFNEFLSQLMSVSGIALAQVQHLVLGLAELHEALVVPFLSLSWSLLKASHPSVVSMALVSFMPSANLMRISTGCRFKAFCCDFFKGISKLHGQVFRLLFSKQKYFVNSGLQR